MAECQEKYPYEDIINEKSKGEWIELSLSRERLNPYMKKAGYDYGAALNWYLFNARLSKSFLFPLHALEITLRNRLSNLLANEFGDDWHNSEDFREHIDKRKSLDGLQKAIDNANTESIEDVVSNTTFEFWTYLLQVKYDNFWRSNFTKLTKAHSVTRGKLFQLIKDSNDFRNRIAHHEPILDKNFKKQYGDILLALGYLNSEVLEWVKSHTTVPAILLTEPSSSGNPKPLLKDKADVQFAVINSGESLSKLPNKRILFCEDEDLVLDQRDVAKYLVRRIDDENNLLVESRELTVQSVITNQKLKKNYVEFHEGESFSYAKKAFQGKKIKYLKVLNTNGGIKGFIEKPHRS